MSKLLDSVQSSSINTHPIQSTQRSPQIRAAVEQGIERWQARPAKIHQNRSVRIKIAGGGDHGEEESNGVLGALPRREPSTTPLEQSIIIQESSGEIFQAPLIKVIGRLFVWLYVLSNLLGGILWDKLLGRDSLKRRAIRLRSSLEWAGGTFVKFGQQAAMRIDLLPWEYCKELAQMLDQMPVFPVEYALETVTRTTGKSWDELFAVFDPQPIGSASIACVYQAILKDGKKVAVKIRRPGIGELFMVDFRVLDWILDLIEFLTIFRPGFTGNFRSEIRETLLEELDFAKEARFQDIFRRNAESSGEDFFSAPKVYFEYSGREMIVQEFVSGMWLWEIIGAKEMKDKEGLTIMRSLNIDPSLVAKRILWTTYWSISENLFFHADPHPANILVRPDSKLTFIDFGSCGSFNKDQIAAMEKIFISALNRDAEGAARATLTLMEPFPPVNVPDLMKEAEAEYLELMYTFAAKAEQIEWWERTSARQWMAVIRLARTFNIPLGLHTLRMIRGSLLADTLVLRLDHTVDRYEEYSEFLAYRAKYARKRWRKRVKRNRGDQAFARLEEIIETSDDILARAHHSLSSPLLAFNQLVAKGVFAVAVLSRMAWSILIVTIFFALSISLIDYVNLKTIEAVTIPIRLFSSRLYLITIVVIGGLNLRQILFRLKDPDPS